MKKTFMGVRLKRLREERRLTQQALASAIGISLSYLNQLENNQRPLTLPVLLKLNAAFGVDVQLFSEDDEARSDRRSARGVSDPAIGETNRNRGASRTRESTCRRSDARWSASIADIGKRWNNRGAGRAAGRGSSGCSR